LPAASGVPHLTGRHRGIARTVPHLPFKPNRLSQCAVIRGGPGIIADISSEVEIELRNLTNSPALSAGQMVSTVNPDRQLAHGTLDRSTSVIEHLYR
jgi:hypothetical protein